ncbi:MAG: glycosyltransferase family 2 protein [Reichenbachiella sp.]|uniref:glycosyltransferase family A protein n=1 Tax=Reichenbachiella sp. TaxID=2184521 RepID=UPI003264081F
MTSSIAIIIPAYKAKYLKKSIESILAQNHTNYKLYLFDDDSPEHLDPIVAPYLSHENVIYHKFDSNLGGTSLVRHWTRCIEKTTEPWIWLFSDDDMATPNCVEQWNQALTSDPKTEVFRFKKEVIDDQGHLIRSTSVPDFQRADELAKAVILKEQDLTMPEYIFSREAYLRHEGLVDFDMAWGTDMAAWLLFSQPHGIRTLQKAIVSYRMGGENISSIDTSSYFRRKLKARISFMRWFETQPDFHFTHQGQQHSAYLKDNILWYIKNNGANLSLSDLIWLIPILNKSLSLNTLQVGNLLLKAKF